MNPMKWSVWIRVAVVVSFLWEVFVFTFTWDSFYSPGSGFARTFEIDEALLWSTPVALFWGLIPFLIH